MVVAQKELLSDHHVILTDSLHESRLINGRSDFSGSSLKSLAHTADCLEFKASTFAKASSVKIRKAPLATTFSYQIEFIS